MPMLVAGSVTRGVLLRDCYRVLLVEMKDKKQPLTFVNIRRFVERGFREFKKQLADSVCVDAIKLTYQEFRHAVAKDEIPETESSRVFRLLDYPDLNCEAIVMMFVDDTTYIFELKKNGQWDDCDNFALIGEGAYVAEAFLYLRKHESDCSLGEALYHVFESLKMAADCVGTVGQDHTISVLYPPKDSAGGEYVAVDELTEKGFKFMEDKFKERFGIRQVMRFPKLPNGTLERVDEPTPLTFQTPAPGQ
jgi:hypothetical protein